MKESVLFNYVLLSTNELLSLFWQLSNSFVEGLERKSTDELEEIRNNLKTIIQELGKRQAQASTPSA